MTPERWQQIEKLYHSAREHGAGVLAETDPEIRREVERLLAQDSEGKLLDRNALELLEQFTDTDLQPVKAQRFAGQIISHYRIEEKIGAGGMGVVYKAVDTKLGRQVALKFLPPHLSDDEELKRRLSDEARAASALDHPNIVVIHDIDETPDGDLFIAMAYHEGVTLRQRIKDGLSLAESLRIARQIASGLAKAHEHGIVHRDIKPGNVIVAKDGIARIIDFGLAKSGEVTATAEGTARGTPLYMSPEQATGGALDARTDLWSLGAVLFQMIAGTPPFRGETQLQLLHAVVHDEPPRLREAQPGVPEAVDGIVQRALQKDLTKRYASAAEMAADLSAALSELESPISKLVGLRPAYAIAASVVVLLAAGVSFWLFQRSEKRHWAREQAIPEIGRLKEKNQPVAAFKLMREAQKHLPGDAELGQIAEGITHAVSVQSMPGASVEIQDYLTPGEPWFPLGTAPLKNVRIPSGYLRWRVAKPGAGEYVGAPVHKDIRDLSGNSISRWIPWRHLRKEWSLCRRVRPLVSSFRLETWDPLIFRRSIWTDSRSRTGNTRSLSIRADTRSGSTGRRSFFVTARS